MNDSGNDKDAGEEDWSMETKWCEGAWTQSGHSVIDLTFSEVTRPFTRRRVACHFRANASRSNSMTSISILACA